MGISGAAIPLLHVRLGRGVGPIPVDMQWPREGNARDMGRVEEFWQGLAGETGVPYTELLWIFLFFRL